MKKPIFTLIDPTRWAVDLTGSAFEDILNGSLGNALTDADAFDSDLQFFMDSLPPPNIVEQTLDPLFDVMSAALPAMAFDDDPGLPFDIGNWSQATDAAHADMVNTATGGGGGQGDPGKGPPPGGGPPSGHGGSRPSGHGGKGGPPEPGKGGNGSKRPPPHH